LGCYHGDEVSKPESVFGFAALASEAKARHGAIAFDRDPNEHLIEISILQILAGNRCTLGAIISSPRPAQHLVDDGRLKRRRWSSAGYGLDLLPSAEFRFEAHRQSFSFVP